MATWHGEADPYIDPEDLDDPAEAKVWGRESTRPVSSPAWMPPGLTEIAADS